MQNVCMLTKKDKEEVQKIVTNAFMEFWDSVLEPYFNRIEQFMDETKEFMSWTKEELKQNHKDHEQMFRLLERNREEHDEFYTKLDEHTDELNRHRRTLKKLETN